MTGLNQEISPTIPAAPRRSQRTVHRERLITVLSDPDLETWPLRGEYYQIIGLSSSKSIYNVFSPEDLDEIEAEALAKVRARYSRHMRDVDKHVLRRAQGDGRTAAADAKLAYQRLEGWEPGERLTLGGGLQVVEIVAEFRVDGQPGQPVQIIETAPSAPPPLQVDDYQPPPAEIVAPEAAQAAQEPEEEPDPYIVGVFAEDPQTQDEITAKLSTLPRPRKPAGRPKGRRDRRPRGRRR